MENGKFIFNVDKCVGCMACIVGCSLNRNISDSTNWRTVNKFNNFNHPDLPVFYYSLACNHCEKAPCMLGCPTKAYSREDITGAVIHDQSKCIGCKYCTWLCPFDAPKYNHASCTIEKCNFCFDLLKTGNNPACVVACPTGALSYGNYTGSVDEIFNSSKPHKSIDPRIKIISSTNRTRIPEILGSINSIRQPVKLDNNKKITAIKEWPLVIFSLLAPLIIAWIISSITHKIPLESLILFPAILISGSVSLLHLGKKSRSWRAIINFRNSWLSREILSFISIIILFLIYYLTSNDISGYSVVIVSTLFLISLDLVYLRIRPKNEFILHSSSALLTAILWWSLLTMLFEVAALITLIKVIFYISRIVGQSASFSNKLIKLTRLILLISTVTYLYIFQEVTLIPFLLALSGEVIDRIEFYNQAFVVSPETLLSETMKEYQTRD